MLTMKARYALRALTALARLPLGQMVLTSHVAEAEKIPRRFLEAILLELKQRGMLQSRKGRGGGYALLVDASQITVESVIEAVDGPLMIEPCVGERMRRCCADCEITDNCSIRPILERTYAAAAAVLRSVTIAELADDTGTCRRERAPARP